MKAFIQVPVFASLLLAGGFAAAQSERLDVTLEVIDDLSEIDAVVVRLEDTRDRDDDREGDLDERLDRDRFDGAEDERAQDGEVFDRERETDLTERREVQSDEETLERDFERELQEREDGDLERETDAERDDLIDSVEDDSAAE